MRDITDGTSNTIMMGEHLKANITPFTTAANNSPLNKRTFGQNVSTNIPSDCLALADGDRWVAGTLVKGRMGTSLWDGQAERCGMTTIISPNGPSCSNDANPNADSTNPFVTPSSNHVGGVQVVMCDGSVRFISENIDSGDMTIATPGNNSTQASPYGTWGALGTRSAGEVVGEF